MTNSPSGNNCAYEIQCVFPDFIYLVRSMIHSILTKEGLLPFHSGVTASHLSAMGAALEEEYK